MKLKNEQPVNPRLPGRFGKMSAAELEAEVAEFDQESLDDHGFQDPTAAELASLRRAKRKKPGRPRVGKGAKRVLLTIEIGLLKAVDSYAKKSGLSRSALIATQMRKVLGKSA